MKKIKILLLIVLGLVMTNCQKSEEEIINQTPAPQNIVVGSPLAKLITRTTQYPTECDNVIDGNSCFGIQLPVTVTVNGNQLNIITESDYQSVQDIKDTTSGNDIVYFNYPITVRFKNHTSQVVSNYSQLQNVELSCPSDDGLNEIDCISINYPIVINVYNTNNQVANTTTIQNNTQLYSFINGLNSTTISAIVYPISVTNSSGVTIVINSNSELENLIEMSIDDCDDNSGGSGNPTFVQILTSASWYVSYFNEDGEVQTNNYNGYSFTFNDNNTVNVLKNSIASSGTWSNYVDSGVNKLDLNFANPNLDDMQEDWTILEYTETVIRLKHVSGGNGGTDYLNFTKL